MLLALYQQIIGAAQKVRPSDPRNVGWIDRRHIAPSGRSRSPAHQEKKGEKKKMEMQSSPCIFHHKVRFFNFSTFKWNFQNYFSAISTTQGYSVLPIR